MPIYFDDCVILQWRHEQLPLLLRTATDGQAETRRAVAGPGPLLRPDPRGRSAGGPADRVGHLHAPL